MAINEELQGFVKDGLARGVSRAEINDVLVRAGWTAEHVRGALDAFAEIEFPIPVPRPMPYLSAREAFRFCGQVLAIGHAVSIVGVRRRRDAAL